MLAMELHRCLLLETGSAPFQDPRSTASSSSCIVLEILQGAARLDSKVPNMLWQGLGMSICTRLAEMKEKAVVGNPVLTSRQLRAFGFGMGSQFFAVVLIVFFVCGET